MTDPGHSDDNLTVADMNLWVDGPPHQHKTLPVRLGPRAS
jgi:hypothetical protein